MVKKAVYEWVEKPLPNEQRIQQFCQENNVSKQFATLCLMRGIDTQQQFQQFIAPQLSHLHDPFQMHDMAKGILRIQQAIENGEHILIYGDYDADGITSTTILYEAIDNLGGNVSFYLPNRFIDGYGPNKAVFQYMIEENDVQLIITCDNGVSGHEAIDYAMQQNVDVIVTDHHELPEQLPQAFALIHPRHPEGNYPFGDLSGAGVAFKVACALLEEIPYDLLEVVAIGTVADLVSLTDENRILVHYGVQQLRQTQRLGLLKLIESSGVSVDAIDAQSIGFSIGPRLNAIGRLDDATPGVTLLTTFDEEEAERVVNLIETKNNERKAIVETIVNDVLSQIEPPYAPVIMLANENWHAGVLGIVASKIVERTNRPTILLQSDLQTGLAKGSGRSIEGIHLFEQLTTVKDKLEKFGGHDMAAGLTIAITQIDTVRQQLEQSVPIREKRQKFVDLSLSAKELTVELLYEFKKLEPFGTGNPTPLVMCLEGKLSQVKRIGANEAHLKGVIDTVDFIQFNGAKDSAHLKDGVVANFLGEAQLNVWNQLEKPQLRVVDSCIDTVQYFDYRSSHIKKRDVTIEDATYIVFNAQYEAILTNQLVQTSRCVVASTLTESLVVENVVFFDCPKQLDELKNILSYITASNFYFIFHQPNQQEKSAYLLGLPTREQLAQLYKWVYGKKDVPLKTALDTLSKRFTIKKELLILMLQMFFEAKFVTIIDGVLSFNENAQKIDLNTTTAFQKHQLQIATEKQLLYSNYQQLVQYIQEKQKRDTNGY